uniref:Uncharacterized protein n=1 Tax=Biomphalaria glabrata TaxID=6526 RepID=A0A2C9M9Z7_BIOGL
MTHRTCRCCAYKCLSKRFWSRHSLMTLRGAVNLAVISILLVVVYLFSLDQVQEHLRVLHGDVARWGPQNEPPMTYCQWRKKHIHQKHAGPGAGYGDVHMSILEQDGQICVHPKLDPCDASVIKYDTLVSPVNCSGAEENWIYVENGTFRISRNARLKYGAITCEYAPMLRGRGDFAVRHGEHIKPMADGTPLVSDFFKVACISPSGKRYHNIHAGIAYNETLHQRYQGAPPRDTIQHPVYDVFMFGFDSTSRMAWLRNLPKSRDYFLSHLGGIELEGYNIVGDGTVQALLPILTGNTEHDLHPARRGVPGSREVDDFPWIWNTYKEAGYVTAWAEDMSHIGTFQLRLHGFKEQPTDHSMRTYFLLSEPMHRKFLPWCIGSEARHQRFLQWFRDMYSMYGRKPKFMFGFHSEFSHNNITELKKMDVDFKNFLRFLYANGHLDNTILILMGDHGARVSELRNTTQGKLEERMPYFAFMLPSSFQRLYPEAVQNIRQNVKRLTTPFDIHETFHQILNMSGPAVDHSMKRGISLFRPVPTSRTCAEAGVEPHWCACLQWTDVQNVSVSLRLSRVAEEFINSLTKDLRSSCAELKVTQVTQVSRVQPNVNVMRFKKSQDLHGDVPDFSDSTDLESDFYQISFQTAPGAGRFEATIRHSKSTNKWTLSESDISRTNLYGSDPDCIANTFPNLRPYCYCIKQTL